MPLTARQRSIHAKNGAKRTSSFKEKRYKRGLDYGEYIVSSAPSDACNIWYPGGAVALCLLLAARLASAYWGHIADCDETYNYWEPLHFLVYGKGLQTWEYSPMYAIRSYLPLWLFAVPAKILAIGAEPVTVFYCLRAVLAILTASAEFMFYKAVCHEFGVNVGRLWLFLSVPCAGCFASSAAMLPSAWSSALVTAATASWWRKRYPSAVMFTAATALLSWPFTALLGVPIAIDMLIIKRLYVDFFKWSAIALIVFLLPIFAVDSWHYGKLVVTPWNIVAYNIFTAHGPDLYGVEPWTYYFVNGFLNFNVVWVLCLSVPVLLSSCVLAAPQSTARAWFCAPYWLALLPLPLWLAVFMLQPHKEERFLYPIYNMIVLGGAISLDCIQKLMFAATTQLYRWKYERRRQPTHYLTHTYPLMILWLLIAGAGGISRIVSLYNNYHGPMTLLRALPRDSAPSASAPPERVLCYGKEWYRAPSHFHLPPAYTARFVHSEFRGQLPAPYADDRNATRLVPPHFNDWNKMDNSTYLNPIKCHYLVDSDIGQPTPLQPFYHQDTTTWEIIHSTPLLDAQKSHNILRAFYVPYLSNKFNVYGNLYLLKNKLLA